MDAKLNHLPAIDDFEKALILAQYAHEDDFRAFTGPEFYQFIKARLDLTGLSNTAGLPEEFPEPNTKLEASNPMEWTVLGPGKYDKIVSGDIVIADDEFAFAQFDGSDFNRVLRVKVPMQDVSNLATKDEAVLLKDLTVVNNEFNPDTMYVNGMYVSSAGNVINTPFGDMGSVELPDDVSVLSIFIPRPEGVTAGKYMIFQDENGNAVGDVFRMFPESDTLTVEKPTEASILYFTINQGGSQAPIKVSPDDVFVQFSESLDLGISGVNGRPLRSSSLMNNATIAESGDKDDSVLNKKKALEIFPVIEGKTHNLIISNEYVYKNSTIDVNTSGFPIVSSQQYNAVYMIPVEPNKKYWIKAKNGIPVGSESINRRLRVVDSSLSIIADFERVDDFVTPDDAAFIFFIFFNNTPVNEIGLFDDESQSWMPIMGALRARNPYSPTEPDDLATKEYVDQNKSEGGGDLSYLRIATLGDSSTASNSGGWAEYLRDATGGRLKNIASGGATWVSPTPITAGCIEAMSDRLINERASFDPNVIVIQGGGNDISRVRNNVYPLGNVDNATSDVNYMNYDPSQDVYSAIRYNVERLKRAFPMAVIILGTTWQRLQEAPNNYTVNSQIAEAITVMSQRLSVKLIDGFNHSGISYLTEIFSRSNHDGGSAGASKANPWYDWVEPNGAVVSAEDRTPDAVKRYGLYTWDGKHVNDERGKLALSKFMTNEVIKHVRSMNIINPA